MIHICTKNIGKSGKIISKNKEGYRDGSELQKRKKQGVVTQQSHMQLHDTIATSLSVNSVVYGPSARLQLSIIYLLAYQSATKI